MNVHIPAYLPGSTNDLLFLDSPLLDSGEMLNWFLYSEENYPSLAASKVLSPFLESGLFLLLEDGWNDSSIYYYEGNTESWWA